MGRSVSRPQQAIIWVYTEIDSNNPYSYTDLIESIISKFTNKFPSLEPSKKWLNNEDKVLLENQLLQVGISVYFNIACIWVIPFNGKYINLSYKFVDTITPTLYSFETLRKEATMSNEMSIYTGVM